MAEITPDHIEFEEVWDGAVDAAGHRVSRYARTSFDYFKHHGGEESFFETVEAGQETAHMRYTRDQAEEFYAWLGSKLGK